MDAVLELVEGILAMQGSVDLVADAVQTGHLEQAVAQIGRFSKVNSGTGSCEDDNKKLVRVLSFY